MRKKVLFICVHNSARSQMAEAFLNQICGGEFEAQSAGLEPGTLNPSVVQVMMEEGIDISRHRTQAVFDVWKSGQLFDYVVTVCSEADAQGCTIVPGVATRLHWPFDDPSNRAVSDCIVRGRFPWRKRDRAEQGEGSEKATASEHS